MEAIKAAFDQCEDPATDRANQGAFYECSLSMPAVPSSPTSQPSTSARDNDSDLCWQVKKFLAHGSGRMGGGSRALKQALEACKARSDKDVTWAELQAVLKVHRRRSVEEAERKTRRLLLRQFQASEPQKQSKREKFSPHDTIRTSAAFMQALSEERHVQVVDGTIVAVNVVRL